MKKNKYLYFIIYLIVIVLLLFLLFIFINDKNNNNKLTKSVKGISGNISKIIYYPFYKNKTNNYKYSENKVLLDEIKELKKQLKLQQLLTDSNKVNASVIKRSTSYWYNIITIDKGKKDNINIGNIVINSEGVVGQIIKVNNSSSDIKLLTSKNKNNFISVMFSYENNYYFGLIDNYNIEKNELHLKNVVGDFNNLKNIDVVTSGLSKNNTKGLLIGKIKNFKKTNYGISNDIYITPSVNFNNINFVTVLAR